MRHPPKNLAIKISDDLDFVYWSERENEIHGERLTKDNKDFWIEQAAKQSY